MVNIWQELRRRRVLRLAGLYIVGAWVLIQVADISFEAWGIPESAIRYLFLAAAAGFPLALVFGWYFDITPSGIVRTPPSSTEFTDTRLRVADYIILAALLGIGLVIVLQSAERIQDVAEPPPVVSERRDNSIAILPFANLDTNPDTEFFSDGVTEELLHRLSSMSKLHVLASNSSFVFRDTDRSPTEISEALGVRYLLRGSIRREANQVRINAQLVDHQGFSVWSDTFDRTLDSVFAIQNEIASKVAGQVLNEIVPLAELSAGRTTSDMAAYDEYLVGKAYFDARTPGWRESAVQAFESAIQLDPNFAPPYAGKAMSIAVNSGLGEHIDEAAELARHALSLDQDLAEAHAILGLVTGFPTATQDLAAAESMLRRAIDLDPSLAIAYNWLHFVLLQMGRADDAHAALLRGLEIDPMNGPMVANAASRESRRGNFARADQLLNRLLAIPEPPLVARFELISIYSDWGRVAEALLIGKEVVRQMPEVHPVAISELVLAYEFLGMSAEADRWMSFLQEHFGEFTQQSDIRLNQLMTRGPDEELSAELERFRQLGNTGDRFDTLNRQITIATSLMQLRKFDAAAAIIESAVGPDIEDIEDLMDPHASAFTLQDLALCYQRTGRDNEAISLLEQASQILSPLIDTGSSPPLITVAGRNRALLGDAPGAARLLQTAVDLGWSDYQTLSTDPAWESATDSGELVPVMAAVEQAWRKQRDMVIAQDAEHDFLAEVRERLGLGP